MEDVTVYGMPLSNYVRTVRMALMEKGVPYRLEPVMANTPEMLALNPLGKVPAFRHGDLVVFESQAICRYIDDAFDGPSLRPGDVAARALIDQWVAASCDFIGAAIVRGYTLAYMMPKWRGEPVDPAKIEAALPAMRKAVAVLDAHLAGREWIAGDGLTLADLFLIPMVCLLPLNPESAQALAGAPNLSRWLDKMKERESFKATRPTK